MPVILRIAVPGNPLRRYFDYLPPADLDPARAAALAPGCRLRVPFGRRSVVAFLAEVATESPLEPGALKAAAALLDDSPLLTPAVAGLCRWAAAYYQHAPGDVFAAAFSQRLRSGRAPALGAWRLTDRGAGLAEDALARAPRQREALAALRAGDALTDDELTARKAEWTGPRPTIYASGALWKYAQLVGSTRLGAVTHPGAEAETHVYMDL